MSTSAPGFEDEASSDRRGGASDRARRLLIVNHIDLDSADLYDDLADRLRQRGLIVGVAHGLPDPPAPGQEPAWDVVVSNRNRDDVAAHAAVAFGGGPVSRPESLGWLEDAGVPTMDWATPSSRLAVLRLFRRWHVDRLILKPSWTYGGNEVCVFGRRSVPRMRWDREVDVVCREVDPADGDVYKVELLAGTVLIGWMSKSPPIREQLPGGIGKGLPGAYGDRHLWDPPAELSRQLCKVSERLTTLGYGHVSVDLMRSPEGGFVAIELNPRSVAIWWTRQFEPFRERHADALERLAVASPTG